MRTVSASTGERRTWGWKSRGVAAMGKVCGGLLVRTFAAACLMALLVEPVPPRAAPAQPQAGLPPAEGQPLLVAVKDFEHDPNGVAGAGVRSSLASVPFVRLVGPTGVADVMLCGSSGDKLTVQICTPSGATIRTTRGGSFAEMAEEITGELRRIYSFTWLSRLQNPRSTFRVALRADHKGAEGYRVGDVVRFHFRSDRDCYLTLIDIGTSGKVTVLYPNQRHVDTFVPAGQEVTIPEETFKIRAQGPTGLEMVVAVATTRPCELSALLPRAPTTLFRSFSDPAEFRRLFLTSLSKGIVTESTPVGTASGSLRSAEWAEASAVFFIR